MADKKDQKNQARTLECIEDALQKLDDIRHSYEALVEKMGHVQLEAEDARVTFLVKGLETAFSNASNDHQAIEELLKQTEMESNRIKSEQP